MDQSKQSPQRRNIAPSGHPVSKPAKTTVFKNVRTVHFGRSGGSVGEKWGQPWNRATDLARFYSHGNKMGAFAIQIRVARWYIFKPKIQILVNFEGSSERRCWYISHIDIWSILRIFAILHIKGHLVYFVVIWYILW
jgi:hypothetical protein